jgi:hypothetical protein
MNPEYTIDINILVSFFRKGGVYNKDILTTLWSKVNEYIESGKIISHTEVFKEIRKGYKQVGKKDDLYLWASSRKNFFHTYHPDEIDIVKKIGCVNPNFLVQRKEDYNADPWLIAQAKINNLIVITDEGPGDSRIPGICKHFDVNCVNLMGFLEKEKIVI